MPAFQRTPSDYLLPTWVLMLNPVRWSFLATPWPQCIFLLFGLGQGHKVTLIMLNPAQKGLGSWNCLSKGLFCFCAAWNELIHGLRSWSHLSSQYYQCLCWGLDSTPFAQVPIGQGVSLWKCFTEQWFKSEIILIVICSMILVPVYTSCWRTNGVFRKQSSKVVFIPPFPIMRPFIFQVCRAERAMYITVHICWVIGAWGP